MPHTPELPSFDNLLENGYQFVPMQYFKAAWALFKQFVGGFVLFTLLMLVSLRISKELPNWMGAIIQLLLSVAWVGYFWVCSRLENKEKPMLNDFFIGFRQMRLFFPTVMAVICPLVAALFIATYVPLPIYLAIVSVALLLLALFIFAIPITAIYNIGTIESLSLSSRLVMKNWISIIFFFLVITCLNLIAIPTIIGVPLTLPLSACAIYCAFRHIIAQTNHVVA